MTDLRSLLDSDPVAGILAVADLREQRAKAATPGPWLQAPDTHAGRVWIQRSKAKRYSLGTPDMEPLFSLRGDESYAQREADAGFIVAEANPDHALAEVALWRLVASVHLGVLLDEGQRPHCQGCFGQSMFPCGLLLGVVAAAKAYAVAS